MRILMVISQFHPMVGGAEKQAQFLARTLMERGLTVDIVTGGWKFGTASKERIDGIQVFRNFALWGMFGIKGIRALGALIYMMSLGLFLVLQHKRYDIIHVHQALYPAFISVLVGKQILRKSVLVKTASSGITSDFKLLRRFPLGNLQLKYLLRNMDRLVTVNRISGKEYEQLGFPKSHITYIPNGVEIPPTGKTNYNQVGHVLTITRFSQEKGVDVLLRAWAEVVRAEKNLKLVILGDGSLEPDLKRLSHSLGMAESVVYKGMVSNTIEFLKKADIFVLPSRSEGMSNALLEAMSYGIPCIATQVGGNSELLGGMEQQIPRGGYVRASNGLLINSDDAVGLSKAILYFIRNKNDREKMGRRGRELIQENYSIDRVADRYVALYRSMVRLGN